MTTKYTHTNIVTDNWEKLADFYEKVFGCEIIPPVKDYSGEWLDKGTGLRNARLRGAHLKLPGYGDEGPTLEIFQYDGMEEKTAAAANRKGLCHLAFHVDDVAATRQKVLEHGGRDLGQTVEREIPGTGKITFINMTDPDGNIIEIQNWSR